MGKVQVLTDLSQCFQSIAYSLSISSQDSNLVVNSNKDDDDDAAKKASLLSLLAYNISTLFLSLQLCEDPKIQEIVSYDIDLVSSYIVLIRRLHGVPTVSNSTK